MTITIIINCNATVWSILPMPVCLPECYSRITIDSSSRFLFFVFIAKPVEKPCSHRYVLKKDVRISRARRTK